MSFHGSLYNTVHGPPFQRILGSHRPSLVLTSISPCSNSLHIHLFVMGVPQLNYNLDCFLICSLHLFHVNLNFSLPSFLTGLCTGPSFLYEHLTQLPPFLDWHLCLHPYCLGVYPLLDGFHFFLHLGHNILFHFFRYESVLVWLVLLSGSRCAKICSVIFSIFLLHCNYTMQSSIQY
jgi:hypothetical protein